MDKYGPIIDVVNLKMEEMFRQLRIRKVRFNPEEETEGVGES